MLAWENKTSELKIIVKLAYLRYYTAISDELRNLVGAICKIDTKRFHRSFTRRQ
jgi:hypothetical protein